MKITTNMLIQAGACAGQLSTFDAYFPAGVIVTGPLCRLLANIFDFEWAVCNLLNTSGRIAFYGTYHDLKLKLNRDRRSISAEYAARDDALSLEASNERERRIDALYASFDRVVATSFYHASIVHDNQEAHEIAVARTAVNLS